MSYIGKQPVPQSLQSRQQFTGDGSTTTFITLGGVELYEDVFLNGVRLSRVDNEYSFDGTTLTITPAPANGDTVSIILRNDHSELIALPITDSQGNNVLSESGSVVTLTADTAVIEGSSSGDLVRITQTGSGNALVVEDSANPDSTPFVVDAGGNVGIGISPQDKLHLLGIMSIQGNSSPVNGNYGRIYHNASSTNDYGVFIQHRQGTEEEADATISVGGSSLKGNIIFFTASSGNATERMRIDSSGNVKINNLGSGDVYATSGNLYISSDIRLKNDLGVIDESAIEIIKQLTPRYYSWKNDESSRQQLGFFAQEVFPILPEAVPRDLKYEQNGVDENGEPILEQVLDENGEPDYQWGFATQPIVAMCVKAIQEQQTLIESQQSQIDALTARIEALETTP